MALLVICVHANFTENFSYFGKEVLCSQDIGYHIVNFISHTFSDFAVPLFYVISGILYRASIEKYTYKELFLKKFFSLFLPYVAWNTIFFLIFFIKKGYTLFDFLQGLWFIPNSYAIGVLTQPWDGPLWFLRDLMIVFLFTPVIDLLMRKSAKTILILMLILYMTKAISWYIIPGISITSLFMFCLGYFLHSTKNGWLNKLAKLQMVLLPTFLTLCIITYMLGVHKNNISLLYNLVHSLNILVGIGTGFSIAASIKHGVQNVIWMGKHTFIIFASHTLFLTYVIKILMIPFGHSINGYVTVLIYFCSVVFTYILTYIIGALISKISVLNKLLAGGR